MTALVFLLFVPMILIDCKITYACLFTYLVIIIIVNSLTSATSKERMTANIIVMSATH